MTVNEYRHTPDMGEISGFGGGYEECCQQMLQRGCEWIDGRPDCILVATAYEGVTGIIDSVSDEAKRVEGEIVEVAEAHGGATGAMVHTLMARLIYIRANGWDAYCDELRRARADES